MMGKKINISLKYREWYVNTLRHTFGHWYLYRPKTRTRIPFILTDIYVS